MQVHRLSSTALWVEIPLSAQTCLLIWYAMALSGLRQGRINSYAEEHFGPHYERQPHLVEGQSQQGFVTDRVKVQAKLTDSKGGTLVEFVASPLRLRLDFGLSKRIMGKVMSRVEEFLQTAPFDWQQHVAQRVVAPIASPHAPEQSGEYSVPTFGLVEDIHRPSSRHGNTGRAI